MKDLYTNPENGLYKNFTVFKTKILLFMIQEQMIFGTQMEPSAL